MWFKWIQQKALDVNLKSDNVMLLKVTVPARVSALNGNHEWNWGHRRKSNRLLFCFQSCLNKAFLLYICIIFLQGNSDIRRWCLCLFLLCLQLQGTQWSTTRLWTSGGITSYVLLTVWPVLFINDIIFIWCDNVNFKWLWLFFCSMQLEKRSLPTEGVCHITMEVI